MGISKQHEARKTNIINSKINASLFVSTCGFSIFWQRHSLLNENEQRKTTDVRRVDFSSH